MRTIVGLFDQREHAHAAIKDLIEHGFDQAEVSLIQRQPRSGELVEPTEPATTLEDDAPARRGLAIGGVAGLLVGASVFFIPGVGPIVALGGIVSTVIGGLGGAFLGNLVGSLKAWGLSDEEAERYVEHVRTGGTLVAVRTDDARVADAEAILRGHGAAGIDYAPGPIERPPGGDVGAQA